MSIAFDLPSAVPMPSRLCKREIDPVPPEKKHKSDPAGRTHIYGSRYRSGTRVLTAEAPSKEESIPRHCSATVEGTWLDNKPNRA